MNVLSFISSHDKVYPASSILTNARPPSLSPSGLGRVWDEPFSFTDGAVHS